MIRPRTLAPGRPLSLARSLAFWCRSRFAPPGVDVADEWGVSRSVAAQMIGRIEARRAADPVWAALYDRIGAEFGAVAGRWRPLVADLAGALGVMPADAAADLVLCCQMATGTMHQLMLDAGLEKAVIITAAGQRVVPSAHALLWLEASAIRRAPGQGYWLLTASRPMGPKCDNIAHDPIPPARRLWADPARRARARRIMTEFEAAGLSVEGAAWLRNCEARLGPTLWRVVHDCLGRRRFREAVEREMGLPERSAKALLAAAVEIWSAPAGDPGSAPDGDPGSAPDGDPGTEAGDER